MAELKLARLPDRTPVKVTISLTPDLHRLLGEYRARYAEVYGDEQPPLGELIAAMLLAFLESDRAFALHRRQKPAS